MRRDLHPIQGSDWSENFRTSGKEGSWGSPGLICHLIPIPLYTLGTPGPVITSSAPDEVPTAPGSTSKGFPCDSHPPIPILLPCLCPPPGDGQDRDSYSFTDNVLAYTGRVSRYPPECPRQAKHKRHHLGTPSVEAWYVTCPRGFHYYLRVIGEETEARSVKATLPRVRAPQGGQETDSQHTPSSNPTQLPSLHLCAPPTLC